MKNYIKLLIILSFYFFPINSSAQKFFDVDKTKIVEKIYKGRLNSSVYSVVEIQKNTKNLLVIISEAGSTWDDFDIINFNNIDKPTDIKEVRVPRSHEIAFNMMDDLWISHIDRHKEILGAPIRKYSFEEIGEFKWKYANEWNVTLEGQDAKLLCGVAFSKEDSPRYIGLHHLTPK